MKFLGKFHKTKVSYISTFTCALRTVFILTAVTALNAFLLARFDMLRTVTEMYILGVLMVSLNTTGYIWGIIASISSVLCINFFFTDPIFDFNFTTKGYPVTFFVLLSVSIVTSALGGRVKLQRELARERTRLTEERQQILIETEKEKMRGNLLRAISHDLRTPLTSILGAAGALVENGDRIQPEVSRELLTGIQEDAEWLLRMVENVLSVTRISGGAPSLRTVSEPLDELFSQVADKVRKHYPHLKLSMHAPDEVTFVRMDQMLIVQVLINLIDNAVRHGGSDTINLCAENKKTYVLISARDFGQGIPPDDLEKIFDGFVSRDNASNDTTRGLGIGLSICRTIVEGHGGLISARNMPDGGACISFTLPIEEVTSFGNS